MEGNSEEAYGYVTFRRNFKCDICAKVYTQKVTLELHIKFVHNKEQVSCGQCDMKFSSRSSLLYHKKFKHEGRTFPCNVCSDKLSTKISLTNHIERKHKSNISEENFLLVTPVCGKLTHKQSYITMQNITMFHEDVLFVNFATNLWQIPKVLQNTWRIIQKQQQLITTVLTALFTAPTEQTLKNTQNLPMAYQVRGALAACARNHSQTNRILQVI